MKLRIDLVDDRYLRMYAAEIELDSSQIEVFEPKDVCTDVGCLSFSGRSSVLLSSAPHQQVRRLRRYTAEYLSKKITKLIVDAMESNDTFDGYSKQSAMYCCENGEKLKLNNKACDDCAEKFGNQSREDFDTRSMGERRQD